ncbi:Nucleolar protein 16 [Erysiphe necator]|uniref:Nucleolar protein 16 n=1 Tax=Uncinula necator TaxID=52586 RepID=A0A0B1P9W7_UNCNE|nr:Nucleolar protein 16 [Erysiphe necator]KHJ33449.1 putative nucleolar protein 16 [Erysiphe necator]
MGRELQKKKRRSSNPKIRLKPKSKKLKILGNSIIAANWDHKKTLSQNYRNLGLTSRLNSTTGGVEKLISGTQSNSSTLSKFQISNTILKGIEPGEARVERDPLSGKILRVIHQKSKSNPLNDLISSESEEETICKDKNFSDHSNYINTENNIIRQLEEQASRVPEKKQRKLSEREQIWIENLVTQYGDEYEKMARDSKLNPMQQTSADIRRRIEKWKASRSCTSSNDKEVD